MTPDGESRAREGPGSLGCGSPTMPDDIAPARRHAVAAMVTVPPMSEEWLRASGYVLAADEWARQKRMARAALDERLGRCA